MTPTAVAPVPLTYGLSPAWPRMSVKQYQRLLEEGIITTEDGLELLEHYLVRREAGDPPHDNTICRANELFHRLILEDWRVRVRLNLTLPDSQPHPDMLIARGDCRTYSQRYPVAADAGLVVEVANSSLLHDQGDKARVYARAGVVRYWIVNLVDGCVEVHEGPSGPTAAPAYATVTPFGRGTAVPLLLDGATVATVAVDDLIG